MTVETSVWHFITQAGPIVKLVMLLLVIISIISWTFIFQRGYLLQRTRKAIKQFEELFWASSDLSQMYNVAKNRLAKTVGLERIFQAGFSEFLKYKEQPGSDPEVVIAAVERAMWVAQTRESSQLETHLPFLATVGSTTPYIGLFGTVWGIMSSFQALGNVQQATIAMVAPGISEALIATAMGLFAAIPAVIAYNRYNNAVTRITNRYETFQEEFINILTRDLHAPSKA